MLYVAQPNVLSYFAFLLAFKVNWTLVYCDKFDYQTITYKTAIDSCFQFPPYQQNLYVRIYRFMHQNHKEKLIISKQRKL